MVAGKLPFTDSLQLKSLSARPLLRCRVRYQEPATTPANKSQTLQLTALIVCCFFIPKSESNSFSLNKFVDNFESSELWSRPSCHRSSVMLQLILHQRDAINAAFFSTARIQFSFSAVVFAVTMPDKIWPKSIDLDSFWECAKSHVARPCSSHSHFEMSFKF